MYNVREYGNVGSFVNRQSSLFGNASCDDLLPRESLFGLSEPIAKPATVSTAEDVFAPYSDSAGENASLISPKTYAFFNRLLFL